MNTFVQGTTKQYIHYNPERTDYSVTPEEIARLEAAGDNLWKDLCLIFGPLGISCLINAIATTPKPFNLDVALFLNYMFAAIGILLALSFGEAWRRTAGEFSQVIQQIKSKPRMEITPSTTNIGSLEVTPMQSDAMPPSNF